MSAEELVYCDLNSSIECLNVDYSYIRAFMNAGIKTIGDLVMIPSPSEVYTILNIDRKFNYSLIRNALMEMGFMFNYDREQFMLHNIPHEYIFTKIEDLLLSNRLICALRHNDIRYLGDLLITKYDKIVRLRNIGDISIKELKEYVHSLGYNFPNEVDSYKDIIARYKDDGIPLVGEVLNFSNSIANVLYRRGIFTLEDFLAYGDKVFKLSGIGKMGREEIKKAMKIHNVEFYGSTEGLTCKENVTEETLLKAQEVNEEIRVRIEKKKMLARDFDMLMRERAELLAKERELDKKIVYAIKAYRALGVNDGIGR